MLIPLTTTGLLMALAVQCVAAAAIQEVSRAEQRMPESTSTHCLVSNSGCFDRKTIGLLCQRMFEQ